MNDDEAAARAYLGTGQPPTYVPQCSRCGGTGHTEGLCLREPLDDTTRELRAARAERAAADRNSIRAHEQLDAALRRHAAATKALFAAQAAYEKTHPNVPSTPPAGA